MSTATQPTLLTDTNSGEAPVAPKLRVLGIPATAILLTTILLPWLFLWNEMRVEWSVNEQYGYGWFVPPFAALLFFLRWPDAPPLQPSSRQTVWFILGSLGLLLILPLRLIEVPNPDWRSAQWVHSVVCAGISFGVLWSAGGKKFACHFIFPICFLFIAIPWPSEIEEPLVQGLMRQIAAAVAETMNLLGIPAQQSGNLIQIRGQMVGVNEACSGIRSLQTTIMAGLLLGDLRLFSATRRLALLLGGLGLALFANYLRSGILVWIAGNYGVDSLDQWHDTAGLMVLVTVILGLYFLASLLQSQKPSAKKNPSLARRTNSLSFDQQRPALRLCFLLIGGLFLVETITYIWYSPSASKSQTPWAFREPSDAPAFKAIPIDNRTRSYLRYDSAIAASWQAVGKVRAACTVFFLRWEAGRTSAIRATMHQPHICLTAMGMKQKADYGIQPWTLENGLELPVREYIFEHRNQPVHVFYVVWRDGLTGSVPDPSNNRWDRFDSILQRRRNPASQTLEIVVNGTRDRAAAQDVFRSELNRLLIVPPGN